VSAETTDMHVRISEYTHAVPARQQTWRTAIIVIGVVGLCILGALYIPKVSALATILTTAIITLGGAWGFVEAIDRWKQPLPPPNP
jgi:hypothetical protein